MDKIVLIVIWEVQKRDGKFIVDDLVFVGEPNST